MTDTAPGRAAEPARHQRLTVSAAALLDQFSCLSLRSGDIGGSSSACRQGRAGKAVPPVNGSTSPTSLIDNWSGRHLAALIASQPPSLSDLLGGGMPVAPEDADTKAEALLEVNTMPGSPAGTGIDQEVRGPLRPPLQWTRVMAAAETQIDAMLRCNPESGNCAAAVLNWQKILYLARDLPLREQLKMVNTYFNRWPYRTDSDSYGNREYWATPREFLQRSGDCEDYCITKYFALKYLGVPVEQMNIVLLIDAVRNVPHAVLTVSDGEDTYVLDNLSELLLPLQRYAHYQPLCSVNERCRITYVTAGPIQ